MKKYKLSIIVGIFFPLPNLFKLFLNSCLNQTLTDVEFIFIVDHPNDEQSNEILKAYKDKFDNNINTFKIYQNIENEGLTRVYKKGLSLARGEYVAFFDSDDCFDKDYLKLSYDYIKKYNSNYILGNCITWHYGALDIRHVFMNNVNINLDDWLLLYKRDFLLKDSTFCATFDTSSDDLLFDSKTPRIPFYESSFYYHIRNANQTTNPNLDKFNPKRVNDITKYYKKRCNLELLGLLKKFNIDPLVLNNEEELRSKIRVYTNLDKADNVGLDNAFSLNFIKIDTSMRKLLNLYIYQIQTKQLIKIELNLFEMCINTTKDFLNVIEFIKLSGVLNCFTFVVDYNIIKKEEIEELKNKFVDLNIREYKKLL